MKARAILEEILDGVATSPNLTDVSKKEVMTIITHVGLLHDIGKMNRLDRAERLERAVELLEKGLPPHVVRQRLMNGFCISRRTAYRVIEEAEKVCQHALMSGTANPYTETYEGVIQR